MVTAGFIVLALLLALGAFAWVLHPLWRDRPRIAGAMIATLALSVGLLYFVVGTPAALAPAATRAPATLDDAIARLEAELREDPNQVEGLRLLARAYAQRGDAAKARDRLTQAARLAPDDADLQVEAAESRALADPKRQLDAQAVALLERAVAIQPMHQRGRWFLGIARRQQGRAAEAARTWEPLLGIVAPATAAALRPQIDAARADAELPPLPASADASLATDTPGKDAPASGNALTIRVAVDPALAARMPGATVFVIARVPGGPPMPVAVERHRLAALPAAIGLDDADGPMPTQKLSALREVEVVARLSRSGDAMRGAGDVESAPVRVVLPARDTIELQLPAR